MNHDDKQLRSTISHNRAHDGVRSTLRSGRRSSPSSSQGVCWRSSPSVPTPLPSPLRGTCSMDGDFSLTGTLIVIALGMFILGCIGGVFYFGGAFT